jgi:rhodanese-related sulfurtransferase
MSIFRKLFGLGPATDYAQLVKNGALILDVRTKGEFQSGHIKGAKNIALDTLSTKLDSLPKDKAIITCCASGMRSASAKAMLKSKGFEAYNGGGWASLQRKL